MKRSSEIIRQLYPTGGCVEETHPLFVEALSAMPTDVVERAGASYDGQREDILRRIRERKISASMSGIEYYDKPWSEASPYVRLSYSETEADK